MIECTWCGALFPGKRDLGSILREDKETKRLNRIPACPACLKTELIIGWHG